MLHDGLTEWIYPAFGIAYRALRPLRSLPWVWLPSAPHSSPFCRPGTPRLLARLRSPTAASVPHPPPRTRPQLVFLSSTLFVPPQSVLTPSLSLKLASHGPAAKPKPPRAALQAVAALEPHPTSRRVGPRSELTASLDGGFTPPKQPNKTLHPNAPLMPPPLRLLRQ